MCCFVPADGSLCCARSSVRFFLSRNINQGQYRKEARTKDTLPTMRCKVQGSTYPPSHWPAMEPMLAVSLGPAQDSHQTSTKNGWLHLTFQLTVQPLDLRLTALHVGLASHGSCLESGSQISCVNVSGRDQPLSARARRLSPAARGCARRFHATCLAISPLGLCRSDRLVI